MTDQELLSDAGALYDHFFDPIYRFVYRRVQETETAQDIVADVFLKACEHLSQFQPQEGASLSSWIYAIARNEVFQYYRKNKHRQTVPLEEMAEPSTPDSPVTELTQTEREQMIRETLRELDQDDREIILLKYFDELSNIEIAQLLNVTPNNLGVRLHRALKKLQNLLENKNIAVENLL